MSALAQDYLAQRNFLLPYESLINREVLNHYPESLVSYNDDWLSALEGLSEKELYEVDALISFASLKESPLGKLCREIQNLSKRPLAQGSTHQLPIAAFDKINDKKEYEISVLAPFIQDLAQNLGTSCVVDIGSGVGNLSRVLSHFLGLQTICVERDDFFQKQGEKYAQDFGTKEGQGRMTFKNLAFEKASDEELSFIDESSLVVGLHTCGALSNELLGLGKRKHPKAIFNLPCCYLLLDPNKDLNLSSLSEDFPLHYNLHSLTLAARFRAGFSLEEFRLKYKAKSYRYALHLFLYKEFGMKEFKSVGDSKPGDYYKDFSLYASKKLKRLKIEKIFAPKFLDDFYKDSEYQKLFHKMFLCNTIRGQFGRLIENTILLDRALYLEEQGYDVSLETYFDETISPRNRGLLGIRHD